MLHMFSCGDVIVEEKHDTKANNIHIPQFLGHVRGSSSIVTCRRASNFKFSSIPLLYMEFKIPQRHILRMALSTNMVQRVLR